MNWLNLLSVHQIEQDRSRNRNYRRRIFRRWFSAVDSNAVISVLWIVNEFRVKWRTNNIVLSILQLSPVKLTTWHRKMRCVKVCVHRKIWTLQFFLPLRLLKMSIVGKNWRNVFGCKCDVACCDWCKWKALVTK